MKRLIPKKEPVLIDDYDYPYPVGYEPRSVDVLRESLQDGQLVLRIGVGIFVIGVVVMTFAVIAYLFLQGAPIS